MFFLTISLSPPQLLILDNALATSVLTFAANYLPLDWLCGKQTWVEFAHQGGKKIFDMDQVRQEIVDETDRLAGTKKAINPKPISLKVRPPSSPPNLSSALFL